VRGLGEGLIFLFWLSVAGLIAILAWGVYGVVWAVNHISLSVQP
jgi:hypothetical protein